MIIPVVITVYSDRSFTFVMKTPPASVLIKKELGLKIGGKPGSGSPGAEQGQGRQADPGAAASDRRDEDPGHERGQHRGVHALASPAPPARWASTSSTDELRRWEASPRPFAPPGGEPRANPDENEKQLWSACDREKRYPLDEACALVKKAAFAKFDESVDLAVRLGVNPSHADQMVRGALVLPHGTGKTMRVLVFAKGEKANEAEAPAPTSSAPTSWCRRCKKASSTSTP